MGSFVKALSSFPIFLRVFFSVNLAFFFFDVMIINTLLKYERLSSIPVLLVSTLGELHFRVPLYCSLLCRRHR